MFLLFLFPTWYFKDVRIVIWICFWNMMAIVFRALESVQSIIEMRE